VLAENLLNLDADVVWQYGPLVEAGWANQSDSSPGADVPDILITTDVVRMRTFLSMRSHCCDQRDRGLFRFIDVTERHHSGFRQSAQVREGLAKIDVHNHVIFLSDNDAEGWHTSERSRA